MRLGRDARIALANESAWVTSPNTSSQPSSFSRSAFDVVRTKHVTRLPCVRSAATRWCPMKPLAPVINVVDIHRILVCFGNSVLMIADSFFAPSSFPAKSAQSVADVNDADKSESRASGFVLQSGEMRPK